MKQAIGFLILAGVAGILIALTRGLTTDRISSNEKNREAAIIAELLGGRPDTSAALRLCRHEVRGYAGRITLLVLPAVDESPQKIAAVRVTSHRETPGIGDFIDLQVTDWILGFNGLSVAEASSATAADWDKTLDAVSGATVTRRAVISGVANACSSTETNEEKRLRQKSEANTDGH